MTELRTPAGGREDDEGDTDEDLASSRYGNGTVSNGQNKADDRRTSTTVRRRYDTKRYQNIRHTNTEKSLAAKKRVIRMLFVVVVEFFVCWTPLWVMNTWYTLDPGSARRLVSPISMNFIHLLTYVSACTNPITYCFMNRKFRNAFLAVFSCCGGRRQQLGWREASTFVQSQRTGNEARLMPSTMSYHLKALSNRYQQHCRINKEQKQNLTKIHISRTPSPDTHLNNLNVDAPK